jgi:hypothetical protein
MKKLALAPIGLFFGLAVAACSLVVNADRSKVDDGLYHPTDAGVTPDAEESDSGEEPTAGASGAAGASSGGEGGAAGAGETPVGGAAGAAGAL